MEMKFNKVFTLFISTMAFAPSFYLNQSNMELYKLINKCSNGKSLPKQV